MTASPLRLTGTTAALALLGFGGLSVLASRSASALDAEVTSDSAAQFYDVRSPTGQTTLERRRLTTTLGVGAYNLLDTPAGDPKAADLSFRARLRYDADYGASGAEQDSTQFASVVPGFQQNLVDLMYAYVEGRRFAGGWLGFKLGRQYVTDVLGWWSFDGGQVAVTTPYYFKAEVYGGLEQRGGMALSTPRFESDGIWRGNRSGYDPTLYAPFQPAAIAPAFGVAVESTGVTWIHGRLSYRRVNNTGSSNLTEFAPGLNAAAVYEQSRVSSEKLGYALDASLGTIGGAKAGLVYDLYMGQVSSIYGSVDAYATQKVTISADYDYYVPSFDGDSIWNFFASEPTNNLGLRANVDVSDHLSIAGSGNLRIMSVQTAPFDPAKGYSPSPNFNPNSPGYYPSNGHPFDEGANVTARWRTGETMIGFRGAGNFGDEGQRIGADVNATRIIETRYVLSGRVGVWNWQDKLEPDRDTTSFGYSLGLGYRFAQRSQASVDWQHDINGLVGQRFRVMLMLTLAVTK